MYKIYLNRCSFHIIGFYHSHDPDANDPKAAGVTGGTAAKDGRFPDGMLRFEKRME